MYVCMYVYVYIYLCMYVCMYVCMYERPRCWCLEIDWEAAGLTASAADVAVLVWKATRPGNHVCMYVCMYESMYVRMYVRMYVCMYT
jgi:hypothetical protein